MLEPCMIELPACYVFSPMSCTGITPSIFNATNNVDVVDEMTLGQLTDYNTTQQMLENHWATWYIESDFSAMRDAGLNFVRWTHNFCLAFLISEELRVGYLWGTGASQQMSLLPRITQVHIHFSSRHSDGLGNMRSM